MLQNKRLIHTLDNISFDIYQESSKNLFSVSNLNFDWYYILPEICLLNVSILGLIIVGMSSFTPQATVLEKKQKITPIIHKITSQGLLFIIGVIYFMGIKDSQLCFNAYIVVDLYSTILKYGTVFSTFIILLCSSNYLHRHSRALMEFPILMTLTIFFLFVLLASYNLFSMFISVIGFSLSIYVLLLTDCINKSSREAAIKYYYLSTISTGLIASGILMAYLLFHSTNFLTITWILHCWTVSTTIESYKVLLSTMTYFIVIGFLFKLAAFPCHLWAPEIYDGAPHPITAFFILPIKIATFGIFLRLLTYVFNDLHFIWTHLIWIASAMSMLWGAFAALVEMRIKRFMAYSSINQMGFLLIGLACGTFEGVRSSLIFLAIYVITNLTFFIIFLTTRDARSGRSLTYLSDLNNFALQNRLLSVTFVIIFFSMAGIPPLAGFFGKFYLLLHAFESKYYMLVIIGLLTSLISTFYYLRLIKIMWFEDSANAQIFFNFLTSLNGWTRIIHNFLEMLLISFILWSPLLFNFINLITYSCVMPLTVLF